MGRDDRVVSCSCSVDVEESDVPFKDLTNIGKMHLDTVLILVGALIHLREVAGIFQLINGCKRLVTLESELDNRGVLGRSRGKAPSGVAYSAHLESAHPSI